MKEKIEHALTVILFLLMLLAVLMGYFTEGLLCYISVALHDIREGLESDRS